MQFCVIISRVKMANALDHDIMRPICRNEIEKMIEVCAKNLPMSIRGFNFLRMTLKLNQLFNDNPAEYEKLVISDYMRRKMYTKRDGNLENCTFISISRVNTDYNIFVFSNDLDELRECLMLTNLIDYENGPFFTSFEGRHRQMLSEVFEARELQFDYEVVTTGRVLAKGDALKFEYEHEIPDDVVVESLCVADADVVDAVYVYRYPGSLHYLKTLIGVNDSIGIFSKDTHELRSWVLVNDQFGLGMVQTLEEHRGKGYAKIVIKALSKIIAAKYGLDVLAFIVQGNKVSEHTFTKLGFLQIPMENHYSWVFMKKR